MGLAAPRKRTKLSHDPNNTSWTNNTQSFGHKLMAAQGWAPGSLLGAKNAPHAQFHTEANASHIRVAIKDDTLGLGAKKGSGVGEGECVGLDAFKDILGRLNGKDDGVIMKEREEKEDLKRRLYVDGKYGGMKFVRGGVLVGDKIQDLIDGEKERVRLKEKKEKKEKKERDESEKSAKDGASPEVVAVKTKKSKKRKADQDVASEEDSNSEAKKAKKAKKKEKKRKAQEAEEEAAVSPEDEESLRKKEKRERKEKRREEKRRKQEESGESEKTSKKEKKSKKRKENEEAEKSSSEDEPSSTKPSASLPTSGTSTPVPAPSFGRHASVRSRFIAQKRAAIMDTASLNQIFMIKS